MRGVMAPYGRAAVLWQEQVHSRLAQCLWFPMKHSKLNRSAISWFQRSPP